MRSVLKTNSTYRALIIDDDPEVCHLFRDELGRAGFEADSASSTSEGLSKISNHYDLILLDLHLGAENALEKMPQFLKESPTTKIWVLTAHSSIETAVLAMRAGASGFFSKEKDAKAIVNELRAAFHSSTNARELRPLSLVDNCGLLGKSPSIRLVLQNIERMKEVDSTVLICGESGTGKELIAQALHHVSPRRSGPFAAINCGAIPETLLESELFGHRKGSFTDAKADRKGLFEQCSGGTLLLDEIGDMPFSLQVKLLRVLQEREVRPIGATQTVSVDTRVLASTNRRLEDEVKEGRFREDLFYRLSVLRIEAPSLRERKEDIPLLVEHFVERYNKQFHRHILAPNQEILSRLVAYEWPGNVRELQNAVERAVVLSPDDTLHLEDIFQTPLSGPRSEDIALPLGGTPPRFYEAKESFERTYLSRLLKAASGNISEAARLSGQHRPHIYRLMQKYGLTSTSFKE